MIPRPIELLDLPTLHRHRRAALYLDSERALTHGDPLNATGLLAHLDPKRKIYTAIIEEEPPLAGSVTQNENEHFARLLYLAPAPPEQQRASLHALLENLAAQAGAWGARQLLAELEEESPLFTAFRQNGFSVYAWQRIWDLSELAAQENARWRHIHQTETLAARTLHRQIVPPLLRQIEPLDDPVRGIVYESDSLQAYIRVSRGAHGIFLRPLIHPEMEEVAEKLLSLLPMLKSKRERPIYLCVRSYQAWLEMILEDLGAHPGARQALMVKHLALKAKEHLTAPAASPSTVVRASHISKVEEYEETPNYR